MRVYTLKQTNAEVEAFAVIGTNLFAGTNGNGVFRSTDNGTSWTAANSGLTTPYVRALLASGTRLYSGTAGFGGGIFVSSDTGASWTSATSLLTSSNVHSLAANGTTLFAGTFGTGVCVSTDSGTSWTNVSAGLTNLYVNALAVSGANLFAGTNGGGVFFSANSGTSWTAVNDGLTSISFTGISVFALAVAGPNLFAGTGSSDGGVFRSSDNGASWTVAGPGLTNTNVNALAVSGSSLFAGTDKGVTLPYRLFIPDNYSPSQKYPLVLTLHPSGEGGVDNIAQIANDRIATSWADPVNQAKHPCLVVSPQAPSDHYWIEADIVATVSDLLDSLQREFTIDSHRLYITGESLGAFGTWDMIKRFPNRFAAAVPMSGSGDPATFSPTAQTSIWEFQGALDYPTFLINDRIIIKALTSTGRTVVYTQCHNNDCTGMSDSTVAMYVMSHADFLYTEYEHDGHGPWSKSYDYPLLFPWVFDQYQQSPGAITITNLRSHRTLKGIEIVNWQSIAGGDSVEIWNSPDAGWTWQMVSRSEPNTGTYRWDTRNFKDGAFELLKVFVKNHEGFIFAHDQSSYFSIDNASSGTPFVKILNEEFTTGIIFNRDTLSLRLLAGDSKTVPLTRRLSYSRDGGQNFSLFDSYTTITDTASSARLIYLAPLENSNNAVIKVEVDDGKSISSDRTYPFIKQTSLTVVGRTGADLPKSLTLDQNYPNPFNPATTVSFNLPSQSFVSLKVFNVLGREVATLASKVISAGNHTIRWDAGKVPSGIYFYRLQAGAFTETKKAVVLK